MEINGIKLPEAKNRSVWCPHVVFTDSTFACLLTKTHLTLALYSRHAGYNLPIVSMQGVAILSGSLGRVVPTALFT